jgi:hypothetical protein
MLAARAPDAAHCAAQRRGEPQIRGPSTPHHVDSGSAEQRKRCTAFGKRFIFKRKNAALNWAAF